MTKEEMAALLNGREYCEEMTDAEELLAKESGLLVVFGASDDLCELRGVIHDEAGVYDGGDVVLTATGQLLPPLEREELEVLDRHGVLEAAQKVREAGLTIKAIWCEEPGYSWKYSTDAPHATFEIVEGADKYCRGIVLNFPALI